MKTLSERIAERVGINKLSSTSHSNRAVVLELRDDVRQAIDDGWSILSIYRTLHDEGKVVFSYQAFRRHVNRLLGKVEAPKRQAARRNANHESKNLSVMPSFTFDANADERKLL